MENTSPVTRGFGRAWKLLKPGAARAFRSAMKRVANRAARHALNQQVRSMIDFDAYAPKLGRKARVDRRDVV